MIRKIIISGLFCAISLISSKSKAENWIKVESNNFIFYSNVSEKNTIDYMKKLERFNFTINALYGNLKDSGTHEKFTIYFVRSHSDLEKVSPKLPKQVLGFVKTCQDGLSGFSLYDGDKVTDSKNLLKADENFSMAIMFHEYSHIFMFNKMGANFPPWYVEGFAEYYGSMRINETNAFVGMPLVGRYYALQNEKLLKWSDIIGENHEVIEKKDNQSAFYAQSWLLTHYITSTNELAEKMDQFLNARTKGEDKVKSFEKIFGIDIDKFDKIINNYLKKEIKGQSYSFKKELDLQFKTTLMPKNTSEVILYDATISSCPEQEYGMEVLKILQKKSSEFPDDDFVQNAQAKAEIIIGDEEKALPYYKSRLDKNQSDAEAWFRYGQILFLTGHHNKLLTTKEKSQRFEEARSAFFKAYKLNPENAQNLYYISQTAKNWKKPDESSVNAAIQALNLQPSVSAFVFNAALMSILTDDFESAKIALQSIASNPHNIDKSEHINSIIDAIDKKLPKEDILAMLKINK